MSQQTSEHQASNEGAKKVNARTSKQSRAMHRLFTDIALYCVEHGIDQKVTLEHFQKFETPVTPEFVKGVWKIIQHNMYGKKSTTELTTAEVDKVYEVFCKFWSEVTNEFFPFPSIDELQKQLVD